MRIKLDPFLILMLAAVLVASFLPAEGQAATVVDRLGTIGVGILFFAHGAALPHRAILSGLKQWQLHLFIFATTFIVFPIAIQPLGLLPESILPTDLRLGFVYLAVLPSAVSSSIAFTAMAKGNVPAAVCNSAGSNVFGLLLTPLLMTLFISASAAGAIDLTHALRDVLLELLLPFALGQAIHTRVADFMARHKHRLEQYDQSVIVLIIYSAFSQSVAAGLWRTLPVGALALAAILCVALLAAILAFTTFGARRLGFSRGDEIAAVFCGSKKSLASGLPLAQVLFAGAPGFGMIVLPIMLYNQIQIIVGAMLARRYANAGPETAEA
ncbi:bile acid:sodium symporter family protein [Aquamicrobium sp. LC103]|uniref:bile acid:sodium symporter family protein n=1 Tax=Aquamicrobium sp. LC103 TaxID=1120658 RepID=UPI00069C4593|nr:bile acid:sodium symporter family protein [Aquamicrobium sp. LC103]TKT82897.1 bile acid:sodium symporter [Aquamicrobium sp. LC103]